MTHIEMHMYDPYHCDEGYYFIPEPMEADPKADWSQDDWEGWEDTEDAMVANRERAAKLRFISASDTHLVIQPSAMPGWLKAIFYPIMCLFRGLPLVGHHFKSKEN